MLSTERSLEMRSANSVMPGLWPTTIRCARAPPSSRMTASMSFGEARYSRSSCCTFCADTPSSRTMMFAVVIARTAGLDRMRSGFGLALLQASRHLRRIALSARLEHAIPVFLARHGRARSSRDGPA